MRLTYTMFWLTIICAGCASRSPTTKPSGPVAGLKPAHERVAYTSEQLGQLYLANVAYGDWYLARLAAACDALAQESTSNPRARYEAMRLKAAQGVSVSSILTSPNPIVQVLSLQVLLELTRHKWISEGKAIAAFGDRGKLLIDALDDLEKRQRTHALAIISANELNEIHEAALRWRAANPAISDVEFIRFEDFATEMARTLAQPEKANFMTTLQSAAAGISETWLLGARALHLMSRYPRIMQWQLEAQTAELAARPETKLFFDDMSRIAQVAEEFNRQVTQFQSNLDGFPQRLADSITSGPVIKEALAAASQAITRGDAATKQLAAVEVSVRALEASVTNLTQQLEQLNRTYDPASVQSMATNVRVSAAREVRSLIYIIAGCLAGLVLLHALLSRRRRADGNGHVLAERPYTEAR